MEIQEKGASQESYIIIVNHTKGDIQLSISEVDSHDWDGQSRPDANLHGRIIKAGESIREREEMNRWSRTCWFRLTIKCSNGNTFSQRIDQAKSLEPRHTSTDYYYFDNALYAIKTRTNRNDNKDNLVIYIEERGKLSTTRSEFSAGAVPVSYQIVDKIADHTYVFTNALGKEINFPCWGGTERNVVKLIAMGDLELAVAIVCYDPYDLRNNYDDHLGGIRIVGEFFGDCSGICYARTGVCHQMANRIMYALDGHPIVESYTPSYKASYVLYGVYGDNWSSYLATCQTIVNRGRALKSNVKEVTAEEIKEEILKNAESMDSFEKDAISLEVYHEGDEDIQNLRLRLLVNTAFPEGYDNNKMDMLMQECDSFQRENSQLLYSFNKNIKTSVEGINLANSVNTSFANYLEKLCNILGEGDFEKVFGMKFDPNFVLVNTEVIQ